MKYNRINKVIGLTATMFVLTLTACGNTNNIELQETPLVGLFEQGLDIETRAVTETETSTNNGIDYKVDFRELLTGVSEFDIKSLLKGIEKQEANTEQINRLIDLLKTLGKTAPSDNETDLAKRFGRIINTLLDIDLMIDTIDTDTLYNSITEGSTGEMIRAYIEDIGSLDISKYDEILNTLINKKETNKEEKDKAIKDYENSLLEYLADWSK